MLCCDGWVGLGGHLAELVPDALCNDKYLVEGFDLGVHDERKLAQLAGTCFRRCEPLLQAGLMDELEASGAVAGRQ